MSAWAEQDNETLVCVRKWQETPDCVSFELADPHRERHFNFKPGQFANLGFSINGQTVYRSYSISSQAQQPYLRFTVKRVAQGLVSQHVVDELKLGDSVAAMKPQGRFNSTDCAPKSRVLLISAGCGITPVMAMAKAWLAESSDKQNDAREIDFLHIARNPEQTIYWQELQQLAAQHSNFHLKLLLKDAGESGFAQGRLTQETLIEQVPDVLERSVYLCGPEGFMQDVSGYLQALGFDMADCHQESFSPEMTLINEEDSAPTVRQQVKIRVPAFGVEVDAPSEKVLLEALETGKLPIIAACRSGICGSCKCRVLDGRVRRLSQETLSEEEIEQGYVLACSTLAESDVELALN
ncbi:hybrid-cluster NAD(P)-dependent oxidoreductase [Vibrio cholerae]|uniref:hybrid-cluster NAD(P)-dependent oxidoreductase n=1 Tax=Vibrio cholerae TaxID=666 RepID=UPI0002734DA4|nr:hybrid-cluster NAD(P)-dependent oxidoreductase [Vibrio cholerae]EGR0517547.1 hybrid-cluster NAD(P)-dependent oxidoreductase [Vibrio cholerae]EGR0546241.1 hybrid-cluster NAD(P)-dependent oxidoreductase [Vibrio cholerae]EGR0573088.1 hybrid-cluster NAD(P)-dependent oxidoreductase [Vibrio cholerae]EGR0678468.1 hybrid-cluster NAD(P)-dependent oxidoreductase [Vibrio cholerae]EGR4302980.1 hybrid-cluster NAD(P)-dependent oxidoreductase [Vibrio cholerae]